MVEDRDKTSSNEQSDVGKIRFLLEIDPQKMKYREMSKMRSLCKELVERWAVPLSPETNRYICEWFVGPKGLLCQEWLLRQYAEFILPHKEELGFMGDEERCDDVLAAGLFCYYGQLLLYYSQHGDWSEERRVEGRLSGHDVPKAAFDFSLLYLHLDYFLDRNKGSLGSPILRDIRALLEDPDSDVKIEGKEGMVAAYRRVIALAERMRESLLNLFKVEVAGVHYQRTGVLSRQDYLSMAEKKGGLTAIAIQTMFGGEIDNGSYDVGACVQLIDDMMDVFEDIKDQHHTIATHDFCRYGNLDVLFCYTVARVESLRPPFTIFKFFMMEILTYVLSQPGKFSGRLTRLLKLSIHLDWREGVQMMKIINGWVKGFYNNPSR